MRFALQPDHKNAEDKDSRAACWEGSAHASRMERVVQRRSVRTPQGAMMSVLPPQPKIARVIYSREVPPGLTFSLVQDSRRRLWIMESCPAGKQFWTMAQAALLPQGANSGPALREILRLGRQMEQAQRRMPANRSSRSRKARSRRGDAPTAASLSGTGPGRL